MGTEMKSRPAGEGSVRDVPELDADALAAIRDLIRAEQEIVAPPVSEKRPAPTAAPQPRPEQRARPVPQAAPAMPEPAAPQRPAKKVKAKAAAAPARAAGRLENIKARVKGYRPTPKHIILASLALLVLMRPFLVLGLMLLGLMVFIGVFLILGYDGFWTRAMGAARWYANKRPHRAAELHRKLDGFAMKWDAILDRFPEGTVDGLYLPDFGELATADKRHDEALERRLAHLREGGA